MTAKGVYEAVLTELNKVLAPSFTLEDFNHFFNKAINQYINRKYNIYDVNQLTTDDLRVLKATAILTPVKATVYKDNDFDPAIDGDDVEMMNALYGATYEVDLPDDYLHILNCICVYLVKGQNYKCYNKGSFVRFGASRLTADMWGEIINNAYLKPSYKKPYYYIHNVNTNTSISTNPIVLDENDNIKSGTDYMPKENEQDLNKIKYGVSKTFRQILNDDYSSETDVPSETITVINNLEDSTFCYVKIPKKYVVASISMTDDDGDFLLVKPIVEFVGGELFETSGFNTYVGYVKNYYRLGGSKITINLEITSNE